MKFAYDLHIHSSLSPCGHNDMTPNNIINMSLLKGLDIISVTDHNTILNNFAAFELGREKGILVIPGLEVTTAEEVHVLCYFNNFKKAMTFSNLIYNGLMDVKNNEKAFGKQIIYDKRDNRIGEIEKLLINSTKYTLEEIFNLSKEYDGVMVPAHVNKSSYSIFSVLGFLPRNIQISSLEFLKEKGGRNDSFLSTTEYNILFNSDAHYLGDINERVNFIDLERRSINTMIKYLKKDEGL